jgi:hypothetical protein
MTEEEQLWLAAIYENYIIQAKIRKTNVLHCEHWSKFVYLHISANKHKILLTNSQHSVCYIDGILVDLEFNAFIKDWGWNSSPMPPNAQYKPISSNYPPIHDEIKSNYSKPATISYHLWHNKVF